MQGQADEGLPGKALPPPPDALSHSLDPDEPGALASPALAPAGGDDLPTREIRVLDTPITSGTMLGPYLVRRLLADGGMGKVFLAEDPQGQPVALKVLTLQNAHDAATRHRFDREGDILARLSHPNIVRMVGRGVDEATGRAYLALEFVPGQDLSNLLQRCADHRLSVDEAVFVLERCARGLEAAHAIGVLHRDIKPANILVTRDGQVKLTDFGVALLKDDPVRLTAADHVMGTLPYLAPEVLGDGAWTTKGDVYGLGCLAFKLMAGQPPFPQRTVTEVVAAHRRQEAPSLLATVPEAPQALADLLARMLAKEPKRRPTAGEVDLALRGLGLAERTNRVAIEWSQGRVGVRAFPSGRFKAVSAPPPPDASTARAPDDTRSPLVAPAPAPSPPPPPSRPPSAGPASGRFRAAGGVERIDRFEVIRRLGKGAMGEVYLVRDPRTGSSLACKVLSADLLADEESRTRFLRELDSMSSLGEHPGIVRPRGHGTLPDGRPYYVMDYVEGHTFKQALKTGLPREGALDVLEQLADALGHAHRAGFVHRDVKPENALVDAAGRGHLVDFGLVKALAPGQRSLTITGEVLGTPTYMAPEQADASLAPIGPQTDVFALGAMLYEVLTGVTPYMGSTAVEVYTKLIEGAPIIAPRSARPGVPEALEAVTLRALSRSPSDRQQDATAFLDDLRAARGARASRRGPSIRVLLGVASVAVLLGVMAVVSAALRGRGTNAGATAAAPGLANKVERALARGDLRQARALVAQASARDVPDAPWVLALSGEPAGALESAADAELPAAHLARVAAWAGDRAAAAKALGRVSPRARARALAFELAEHLGSAPGGAAPESAPEDDDDDGQAGWSAVARGEQALAEGDPALAALAFDEAATSRASDEELALAAALGLTRVAIARGELAAAREALAGASKRATHPLDVGRCAAWAALLTAKAPDDGAAWVPEARRVAADALPGALFRARVRARSGAAAGLTLLREAKLVGADVGSFADAERLLLLRGQGGAPGLLVARGIALAEAAAAGVDRGGASRALELLATAASIDSGSAALACAEGLAALVLQDAARARAAATRALTLAPGDARAALLAARARATEVAAKALEVDLARVAGAPGPPGDEEQALADGWAEVARACREVASSTEGALAEEARACAAWAAVERIDRLGRAGLDERSPVFEGARRQLAGDLEATTGWFVGPLADARGRLARALIDPDNGDAAALELAEAELAGVVGRLDPARLPAIERALLTAASAGGDGGVRAAEALLALAGDAPARAVLREFGARSSAPGAARRDALSRALALAPDAPPVLLAAARVHLEGERSPEAVPTAAALLGRAATRDVDATWVALRLLMPRAPEPDRTGRLLELAEPIAGPWGAPVTRALVLAAVAAARQRPDDGAWRVAAREAGRAVMADPASASAHLLRALALARAGAADGPAGRCDPRLVPDVLHALACARAASPSAHAPWLLALHLVGLPDSPPLDAFERLLAHGFLRNHRALVDRPEGGVSVHVVALAADRLTGNLADTGEGFLPDEPLSPRGPWTLAANLEKQDRFPRVALALRLDLVAGGRTPSGAREPAPFEELLKRLPGAELPLRDGAEGVFGYERARDEWDQREELLPPAAAAILRARAGGVAAGPIGLASDRALRWVAPGTDDVLPQDTEIGLVLEQRARRPELFVLTRCWLELGDIKRKTLLTAEDLARPWSPSRAALEGARQDTVNKRTLEWNVADGSWAEAALAVGRVAAFPGENDQVDRELRDAIEDELVDEAAWDDDAARRAAAWRVVAGTARDGRLLARDPRERAALAGLEADGLLYEAGNATGQERAALLERARTLSGQSGPEQVEGSRRGLEAVWRRARVLAALDDPGLAGALEALAGRVRDDEARKRLSERVKKDSLWPLLETRPAYAAWANGL